MRLRPPLPREHGAWAALYAPFISAVIITGAFDAKLLLLLISFSGIFAARQPLMLLLRAGSNRAAVNRLALWLALYMGLGLAAGLALTFAYRLWLMVPLGATGAALLALHLGRALEREDKAASSEFLAMAGLTLTGPASVYVATGKLDCMALILWLAHLLYFASSIFYVKMLISFRARQKDPRRAAYHCALYHASLMVLVLMVWRLGILPAIAIFAFAPIILRAFWGISSSGARLNLRRIGLAEMVYAALFILFFALGWRSGK